MQGVAGGGNYSLQAKSVTPTKSQQAVTADSGYYGLSGVTVAAIPPAYQDVSSVTATAGDVLANKIIVTPTGAVTAGTMPNNGAITRTLNTTTTSTTIPAGYHNGNGTVSITTETKTATPTKASQTITPTAGNVLSQVTVNPIPDNYIDTSDATATSGKILTGFTAYVDGELVEGTVPVLPNDGATLDTVTTSYSIDEGYHDGTGVIDVAADTRYEENAVVPTTEQQLITGSNGAFLTAVLVDAIPSDYQDITGVTATAADVLDSVSFVDASGQTVTGSITTNSSQIAESLDTFNSSYTVTTEYYSEGGTVSVNYETIDSSNPVIPSTEPQIITGDSNAFLDSVYVDAIPSNFIDTTNTTATAANILSGQTAAIGSGVVTGTMPDLSGMDSGFLFPNSFVLDGQTIPACTSYTIAQGYHNGLGTVSIQVETATATPTKQTQTIYPSATHTLSYVTVNPIPANYIDTTDADATAAHILTTKSAYVNGVKIAGTMANNGSVTTTIDGMTTTSTVIPAGYTTGGTISLTNDIEQALAAI